MKFLDDTTQHLGFCVRCIRVRWLKFLLEPGDEEWREESIFAPEQGVCRTCAREEAEELFRRMSE